MGCGCSKNRLINGTETFEAQAHSSDIVDVRCETCTGPLIGLSGSPIPVHITTVRVTRQQYDSWLAQGYPVEIV